MKLAHREFPVNTVPGGKARTGSFLPLRIVLAATLSTLAMIGTAANAATVEVLVTGLDNPRGIAIGPAGRILIAEAGTGGTGAGGATPAMTGHLTEFFKGKVRRLLALPSVKTDMGEVSGPTSVAAATGLGEMFVTMGGGPTPPFGYLLRANPARTFFVADIEEHELVNNPDGVTPPDSNPYGVAVVGDGSLLVADAGANTLLQVDRNGTVHTVAVFPTAPNPLFPSVGPPTVQAVPTSIAIGPDGGWYVGELRGFPFVVPSHVWRVEPGSRDVHCVLGATTGPCVDWASGLRHVVSIAFGPDGDLYVSQFGPGPGPPFLPGWGTPGAVVRVDADTKAVTAVVSGLNAPGGIAVDANGTIFVTNKSTSSGTGELLRITP